MKTFVFVLSEGNEPNKQKQGNILSIVKRYCIAKYLKKEIKFVQLYVS